MVYQLEHHAPVSKVIYIDSRDASQFLTTENGLPLTSHFQYIFDDSKKQTNRHGMYLFSKKEFFNTRINNTIISKMFP